MPSAVAGVRPLQTGAGRAAAPLATGVGVRVGSVGSLSARLVSSAGAGKGWAGVAVGVASGRGEGVAAMAAVTAAVGSGSVALPRQAASSKSRRAGSSRRPRRGGMGKLIGADFSRIERSAILPNRAPNAEARFGRITLRVFQTLV